METLEIYAGLKTEESTNESFGGVYPIDRLPLKQDLEYNESGECFLVVNLDPSYKSGSHWIALYINASTRCNEYFDSYGEEPNSEISSYLRSFLRNKKQLQSAFSTTCGQWCMLYIWYRCNGYTLEMFVKKFHEMMNADVNVNDIVNEKFEGRKKQVVCSQMFWVNQIAKVRASIT